MDLKKLANIELELSSKVTALEGTIEYKEDFVLRSNIPRTYRLIHKQYAQLAKSDLEPLKRGLFLQWYSLSEPFWLTGIYTLDEESEHEIILILNEKILKKELDVELHWMLNFYLDWDYAFQKYKGYTGLDRAILEREDNLPALIDCSTMKDRGQMGMYWSSIENLK